MARTPTKASTSQKTVPEVTSEKARSLFGVTSVRNHNMKKLYQSSTTTNQDSRMALKDSAERRDDKYADISLE